MLKTFHREKTDRVSIGYEANETVHRRLASALGIAANDYEGVLIALGVDYRSVGAPYTGPALFPARQDRRCDALDGFYTKWVENKDGGYWDFCDFPLEGASDEKIASYPVPNPDHFDYDAIAQQLTRCGDYAVHIGGAGIPDVINSMGRIMSMEDILCNLITEDPATMTLLNRRMAMYLSVQERILDKYKGKIDFLWMGEDLGTQHAPMISLELYRKVLKPIHKQFIDLASGYNLPVMVHSCGCASWVYEDFIEMGVSGVDSLQPEAENMSPSYLKSKFGDRLSFRGLISTAGPLAYGSAEDTRQDCKNTLDIMMKGGGYHFAPSHAIQDNTPVENIVAMYQAAHDFGRY